MFLVEVVLPVLGQRVEAVEVEFVGAGLVDDQLAEKPGSRVSSSTAVWTSESSPTAAGCCSSEESLAASRTGFS